MKYGMFVRSKATGAICEVLQVHKDVPCIEYENFLKQFYKGLCQGKNCSVQMAIPLKDGGGYRLLSAVEGEHILLGHSRPHIIAKGDLEKYYEPVKEHTSLVPYFSEPTIAKPEEVFISGDLVSSEALREWVGDTVYLRGDHTYAPLKDDRPEYYKTENSNMDIISVSEKLGLGFSQGNVLKYLFRAGKKEGQSELKDLGKARVYLNRIISEAEQRHGKSVDDELKHTTEKRIENN